jgi:hypothetical protein
MLAAGFEPTIPASEHSQAHALDCAAAGMGRIKSIHKEIWNWYPLIQKSWRTQLVSTLTEVMKNPIGIHSYRSHEEPNWYPLIQKSWRAQLYPLIQKSWRAQLVSTHTKVIKNPIGIHSYRSYEEPNWYPLIQKLWSTQFFWIRFHCLN